MGYSAGRRENMKLSKQTMGRKEDIRNGHGLEVTHVTRVLLPSGMSSMSSPARVL